MEFSTEFKGREEKIIDLFSATFTASEGEDEGALIGELVRNLLGGTAEKDLYVFTAIESGVIIGSIVFSRLTYEQDERIVFVLAPVAVATDQRYTILYVDDVAATLDFYGRGFALEQAFLHPSGDHGELSTGETKLAFSSNALMQKLGKTPAKPDPKAPVFELAFETDDVRAALDRSLAAGATLEQGVREEPWRQTTAYVSDANGYLVEICSPVQLPSAG